MRCSVTCFSLKSLSFEAKKKDFISSPCVNEECVSWGKNFAFEWQPVWVNKRNLKKKSVSNAETFNPAFAPAKRKHARSQKKTQCVIIDFPPPPLIMFSRDTWKGNFSEADRGGILDLGGGLLRNPRCAYKMRKKKKKESKHCHMVKSTFVYQVCSRGRIVLSVRFSRKNFILPLTK